MDLLQSVSIQCPYCSETIELLIDCSVAEQEYTEDCEVCCRPMVITVSMEDGEVPTVEARREDE